MRVNKELKVIRELLSLTQEDLALNIGVSLDTISRWENEKTEIEEKNIDAIYNYALEKGININKIYEQIFYEDCEKTNSKLLFHGARNIIELPLDLKYSKENNDFGRGFYLGENFEQASTYISNTSSKYVYSFSLNINKLKVEKFNVNTEWMLAIAYYRGWLQNYNQNVLSKKLKTQIL